MVLVRATTMTDWQALREIRLQPLPSNPTLGEIGMQRPVEPAPV